MSGEAGNVAVFPGVEPAHGSSSPGPQYQELWFAIAQRPWASLVLVPADVGQSAGPIAKALAEVGTRLRDAPVNAIIAESIDYAAARSLSELQPRLRNGSRWDGCVDIEATPAAAIEAQPIDACVPQHEATLMPPFGRAIIAVRPVISEPLGIAIAHAADAVVICLQLGASRTAATRRTIELIGTDRIMGVFIVR